MNETIKLLMERKSVRQFVQEPMPREDVEAILNAAVQAPSAGNMTLWTIINVTDPEKKLALSKSCDNQPFIATAPLVLVFCADYRRWFEVFKTLDLGEELRIPATGDFMLATADTIIAAHATVVAADALGYGSCYIGDIIEHCDTQREILGLPEYVKPVAMAVFGKPTASQIERKKPPRFKLEDVVHENCYKQEQGAQEMISMLKERQGLDDEAFDRWIMAFTKRKWNCDFSREMSRSAAQMIQEWCEGK
ncbi:MAG: nitroreductase family protein [Clostridia bacterium]|nr:nitroreductase family protein [Clostridia bacterium]